MSGAAEDRKWRIFHPQGGIMEHVGGPPRSRRGTCWSKRPSTHAEVWLHPLTTVFGGAAAPSTLWRVRGERFRLRTSIPRSPAPAALPSPAAG